MPPALLGRQLLPTTGRDQAACLWLGLSAAPSIPCGSLSSPSCENPQWQPLWWQDARAQTRDSKSLICISLMAKNVGYLFMCLPTTSVFSLGKCLFKLSASFQVRLYVLLLMSYEFFIYYGYKSFIRPMILNISSHSVVVFSFPL